MKKVIIILAVAALCLTACVCPHKTVGDEYVVTRVQRTNVGVYGTEYYVVAVPLQEGAGAWTFAGNTMQYYTNVHYNVGDTLKIVKK